MSQAITNSGGFFTTGNDDGKEHFERHSREDDFERWKDFDSPNVPNIIQLYGDERHTREQALEKAQKQGLLTEEKWAEKNAKKRPSRREASYEEYISKTSSSLINQLEKNLGSNSQNKQQSRQQLTAIKYNEGFAIHGNLFYLGDVSNYENKTPEEIAKYREFEVETLKEFFNSKLYQELHKNTLVRAEIHTDEAGAIHLQTSDVYFKSNSRGRVQVSKNSMREDALIKYLGVDEFERLLQREFHVAKIEKKEDRTMTRLEVEQTVAFEYQYVDPPAKMRDLYVNRLFRRLESDALEDVALEKAKELNVEWAREYDVTDKIYLDKDSYKKTQEAKKKLEKEHQLKDQLLTQDYLKKRDKLKADEIEFKDTKNKQLKELETVSNDLSVRETHLRLQEAKLREDRDNFENEKKESEFNQAMDFMAEYNPEFSFKEFVEEIAGQPFELSESNRLWLVHNGADEKAPEEPISTPRGRMIFRLMDLERLKQIARIVVEYTVQKWVENAVDEEFKTNKKIEKHNILATTQNRLWQLSGQESPQNSQNPRDLERGR